MYEARVLWRRWEGIDYLALHQRGDRCARWLRTFVLPTVFNFRPRGSRCLREGAIREVATRAYKYLKYIDSYRLLSVPIAGFDDGAGTSRRETIVGEKFLSREIGPRSRARPLSFRATDRWSVALPLEGEQLAIHSDRSTGRPRLGAPGSICKDL